MVTGANRPATPRLFISPGADRPPAPPLLKAREGGFIRHAVYTAADGARGAEPRSTERRPHPCPQPHRSWAGAVLVQIAVSRGGGTAWTGTPRCGDLGVPWWGQAVPGRGAVPVRSLVPWLSCLSYGAWCFPSAELLPGCQHKPPWCFLVVRGSKAGSWASITPPFPPCWGWGTQPSRALSITVPSALALGCCGTALPRLCWGAAPLPGGVQVGTGGWLVSPRPMLLLACRGRPGPAFPELSTFPGSPLPPPAPRCRSGQEHMAKSALMKINVRRFAFSNTGPPARF